MLGGTSNNVAKKEVKVLANVKDEKILFVHEYLPFLPETLASDLPNYLHF